ncbi:hypothetical protein M0R45_026533 [Rubus argutus]|uniref:Uncharacterized protein n=1 Tax=Rubus argutus TaxID=59490 RepID=A0AAW1WZK0_RUBAR
MNPAWARWLGRDGGMRSLVALWIRQLQLMGGLVAAFVAEIEDRARQLGCRRQIKGLSNVKEEVYGALILLLLSL